MGNRLCWWGEAWDVFAHRSPEGGWSKVGDVVGGAGAGTFEIARKRFRPNAETVLQPHNVPLQQLADGGVVAFGLFVVLVLGGIAVCVCALRRLAGPERTAAVALVAAPAAYLAHALVDYNWDFLAVTAPTMVALGVLAGAGRETRIGGRSPVLGVGAVLLAVVVLVSFSFPRLADRAERRSTQALADGDLARALDEANWARFFDPRLCGSDLRQSPRRGGGARSVEGRALVHRCSRAAARQSADVVHARDLRVRRAPKPVRGVPLPQQRVHARPEREPVAPGGPLDVSRDAVNAGGCAPRS